MSMNTRNLFFIYRSKRFSPHKEQDDRNILEAVAQQAQAAGATVTFFEEDEFSPHPQCDLIFSMAREDRTLDLLKTMEQKNVPVINPPDSVRACRKSFIEQVMKRHAIPHPDRDTGHGWWIKRGDSAAAQDRGDVIFCKDNDELEERRKIFRQRGIIDFIVQPHVPGTHVKFYGIAGTGFFRCFLHQEKGSMGHVKDFQQSLYGATEALTSLINIKVYGGDAIVQADGSFKIIDFNDWPSFSPCRQEAAKAIWKLALK